MGMGGMGETRREWGGTNRNLLMAVFFCALPHRSPMDDATIDAARAIASISANIGEGYSRMSAAERARFFTFALGSTREAISWYTSISDLLPPGTAADRVAVLSRIRRLLLGLIRRGPQTRWHSRKRSEPPAE
jgi:four helix bundle protein